MASCNSYGWSGGFASLLSAFSWFLFQERTCQPNLDKLITQGYINKDHIQVFHYIAIVVGLLLFVLSFFNFAEILSEVLILFVVAVLGIFLAGCLMLYNVYIDFYTNCNHGYYQSNIFQGNDYFGIGVFVMDLNCALLLITAALAFSRAQ